ncbi:MAG: bifunctional phosphoribosyl-AMP cyclohydrolase/phosphoribosyl-ATP diphosphatase HisIE [Eubacteriales bacterium]|jgi:phosphoribosyl-ATP pyrophosphohydrolase/phosphoribosyl-AMP cyclohydrolase|nr:bifunctional phosphoribosyl-AMP cyclohydrolase/phosphoribosyl-ATP diphosphatase HisIE [Eubacteriales bacterium]
MKEIGDFFKKSELIPAVIRDAETSSVLMLAYMNEESLTKTLESGTTWFYSRSRSCLWNKGAGSGHFQYVKSIKYDCDDDTLLISVDQIGAACHSGAYSCFDGNILYGEEEVTPNVLYTLYKTVADRKASPQQGSYTCYLFNEGLDKILKKVGEECSETIIAAKNSDNGQLTLEISDLIYHLMVLMNERNLPFEDVLNELEQRSKKIGNLKQFKNTDKNT